MPDMSYLHLLTHVSSYKFKIKNSNTPFIQHNPDIINKISRAKVKEFELL